MNESLYELFPFFRNIDCDESFIKKTIPKGVKIFDEGDMCGGVPFILKGTVRVCKVGKTGKEMNIYRVSSGDTCILTVTCVLSNSPYPLTAIAEEEVETVIVPYEIFKNLMIISLPFQEYIYKLIITRYQELLTLIDETIFHSTDERIVRFLIKHTKKDGDVIETTHDKIGIEIGTAREVVSRFLKELERKNWIQLARGKIVVKNRTILEQRMANFD